VPEDLQLLADIEPVLAMSLDIAQRLAAQTPQHKVDEP